MKRAARYAVVLTLAMTLLALGWNVYYRAIESEAQRSDFLIFHAASRTMLAGGDVYAVRHPRGWPFFYPPAMPALISPIGLLPIELAVVAWYLVSIAALGWVFVRLVLLCDELAGRAVGPFVAAAFLVNFGPLISGMQRGQVSILLFAIMVEAFCCYRRSHTNRCALWLSLAVGLKVYPGLLLLPLLLRREWKALATFGVSLVVLCVGLPMLLAGPVAGWDTARGFLSSVLFPVLSIRPLAEMGDSLSSIAYFSSSNQSFYGVLGRWLCLSAVPYTDRPPLAVLDLSPETVRHLTVPIRLVLVVVVIFLFARRGERHGLSEAIRWSLLMVGASLISPVAWHHYYSVLAMPYALAAVTSTMLVRGKMRICLIVLLALAVVSNWLHFANYTFREMGVLLVGSLALCVGLAIAARRWPEHAR